MEMLVAITGISNVVHLGVGWHLRGNGDNTDTQKQNKYIETDQL